MKTIDAIDFFINRSFSLNGVKLAIGAINDWRGKYVPFYSFLLEINFTRFSKVREVASQWKMVDKNHKLIFVLFLCQWVTLKVKKVTVTLETRYIPEIAFLIPVFFIPSVLALFSRHWQQLASIICGSLFIGHFYFILF